MIDPIKTEIIRANITAVAEEMGVILRRSSFSTNIKERLDFSCAIFNRTGELVAHAEHIPVHIGSMVYSMRILLPRMQRTRETIIVNDPYSGGTHLPDITLITPVFADDSKEAAFYVANRAHHADIGAKQRGVMPLVTSIEQEGVLIRPVEFTQDGQINRKVLNRILNNVRTFEERLVDLTAQVSVNQRGVLRLSQLISHYGLDNLHNYLDSLLDSSESVIRTFIAKLPQGTYSFEDVLDDDSFSQTPIAIACCATVEDNRLTFDFSSSADQVKGPLNTVEAVVASAVYYCLMGVLQEEEIPRNSGMMRPIRIVTRPGSVLNPHYPAAVGAGNVETSQRIVDVILGVLRQLIPERIPAASQGTMNNLSFEGLDTKRKRYFTYYETIGGGAGAGPDYDGTSGVHCHMTNTLNTPVEVLEHQYPLRAIRYQLRRGSGGNGLHKGGDGLIRELEALVKLTATIISERRVHPPYGLDGGNSGRVGKNTAILKGLAENLKSKETLFMENGDRITIMTPGGGGYGKA